ncbi:MAG TPA: 2Fe-2S iron-sulfur cluster-binding protein, partial [Chthoniobacterales bacterium]
KKVAAVVSPEAKLATGYSIQFKKSGKTAQWCGDYTSILDLAEANGVSIPSGCRAGSCGTCQVAVFSGEIDYIEQSDFETNPGTRLTCIGARRAISCSTSKVGGNCGRGSIGPIRLMRPIGPIARPL